MGHSSQKPSDDVFATPCAPLVCSHGEWKSREIFPVQDLQKTVKIVRRLENRILVNDFERKEGKRKKKVVLSSSDRRGCYYRKSQGYSQRRRFRN